MPHLKETLAGGATGTVVAQLETELALAGFAVDKRSRGTFGTATAERVREFQEQHHLPVTGDVDPATGGIVALQALVLTTPDKAALRKALRNAESNTPGTDETGKALYRYWLAHAAILAGDYELAARVRPPAGKNGVPLDNPLVLLDLPARAPEAAAPENYYTYQYEILSSGVIAQLRANSGISLMLRTSEDGDWPEPRDPEDDRPPDPSPRPPLPTPPNEAQRARRIQMARNWIASIEAWQAGNDAFRAREYAAAVQAFDAAQRAAFDYLEYAFAITWTSTDPGVRLDALFAKLTLDAEFWFENHWGPLSHRFLTSTLTGLRALDWPVIGINHPVYALLHAYLRGNELPSGAGFWMDMKMVVMAALHIPLARAEANRLRRQGAATKKDMVFALRSYTLPTDESGSLRVPMQLAHGFIEVPYANLAYAEMLADQAEIEFKSRVRIDEEPDAAVRAAQTTRINALAADFVARQIPGGTTPAFQNLVAALTYAEILERLQPGTEYVARTRTALNTLAADVQTKVTSGDVTSLAYRKLGQGLTVPTVVTRRASAPGLGDTTHPHEKFVDFAPPAGQTTLREANPRTYAVLLSAQARLLQIWSGFNYLGYRDNYVPPWRFSYLLERGRYFCEHAKNAQRDYMNFLGNAENEEFKELSAGQNVELEKSNVQVEAARVDQAQKEVAASVQSVALAALNEQQAAQRAQQYASFDRYADRILDTKGANLLSGVFQAASAVPLVGTVLGGIGDFFSGGAVSRVQDRLVGNAQRELEKNNLRQAVVGAQQAKRVAQAQLDVTKAGLIVAGLQRQVALLRHEHAVQNLAYLRNRVLNAELWFRLAGSIRAVADTYLRYAIEMSFLAQQAYNFEADKRLNVVRFDYDLSDVGAMLAADFLRRDLDTLEQDLVIGQDVRQQQVRYVVSLAREFPETLRELSEQGRALFDVRLESVERRFPGLANLRIAGVELQPIALMDPTRLSVALTHLGSGFVRLRAQPGDSTLNASDVPSGIDWLPGGADRWPLKLPVSGPDTGLYSGVSRQDAGGVGLIATNQRNAFEGLPGASSWQVDLSARENGVVPGTLADLLVTFTLSGYHDPELRDAIAAAPTPAYARTSIVSARASLPDAYYSLARQGRLDWDVSQRMLSRDDASLTLRNLAVALPLAAQDVELGRSYCRYPIDLEILQNGTLALRTPLPQITIAAQGLTVTAGYAGPTATAATWDFGDGSTPATARTTGRTYARPGRYVITVRLVADGRATTYRAAIVVSAQNASVLSSPLIALPALSVQTPVPASGPVGLIVDFTQANVDIDASIGLKTLQPLSATRYLIDGLARGTRHRLQFFAARRVTARLYSQQRHQPATNVVLTKLRATTNRTFDAVTGAETTTSPNALTTHLFGATPAQNPLSPIDRWTLELPLDQNPWLRVVNARDAVEFDGSEFADAAISLEHLA